MVIAELLNKIKDLEKQRRVVQSKLRDSAFILPQLGENEKPDSLEETLEQLQLLVEEIADLKTKLIWKNCTTEVLFFNVNNIQTSMNLMEAIKLVETYRVMETQYSDLAALMESKSARFFRQGGFGMENAVQLVPNFKATPKEMRKESEKFREAARRVEQAVVKKNWSTEAV